MFAAAAVPALDRVLLGLAGAAPVDLPATGEQWCLTVGLSLVAVPLLIRAEHALVRRHLA